MTTTGDRPAFAGARARQPSPEAPPSPLVSVIMPAYNAATTIADAIGSVVAQTYTHWELVVVNDGSTDATAEIVAGFGLPPAKLSLICQENAGEGVARNRAIDAARGELIAFLDSDDIWEPAKLERQVPVIVGGDYDVVFSSVYLLGDPTDTAEWIAEGTFTGPEMFRLLYQGNRIPVLSVLATKRAIARAGGFKAVGGILGEDYDLWLRMANTGSTFRGLPDRLGGYRDHPGSHLHHVRARLEGDLAAVSQFDAQVAAEDPPAYRRRMGQIHNELASAYVGDGDMAGARRSLAAARQFEAPWRVALKAVALALLRRRYGALRQRAIG